MDDDECSSFDESGVVRYTPWACPFERLALEPVCVQGTEYFSEFPALFEAKRGPLQRVGFRQRIDQD
jgi:hypothetical protein